MLAVVNSFGLVGLEGYKIDVEVDVNMGLPKYEIVGLPDASVKEAKERVRSAIKNSGFKFPSGRITVNLAPANKKKEGSGFDLAMAVAILFATEQLNIKKTNKFIFLGELGLDGSLKAVNGLLPMLISARAEGYNDFIIPAQNMQEASYIDGTNVYALNNFKDVVNFLSGELNLLPIEKKEWKCEGVKASEDFARVKGQAVAKRAMEIAVAGGHNILMVGPPGSGKTMLAHCVPSILPDLTFEEALEITKIHSVAGVLDLKKGIVTSRPFRSPHHTASTVALTGGGKSVLPGEISLAHNGVLFLDEMPEYSRDTLETLRQPLEDGCITVSRASGTVVYPANFILIASMNPCPCGNFGSKDLECTCSPSQIQRYMRKISGPLLDRIDIKIDVDRVAFVDLNSDKEEESSAEVKKRVDGARKVQLERYKNDKNYSNAKMNSKQIKLYCKIDDDTRDFMEQAFEKFHMSARAYNRILKVARTIADLEGKENIEFEHVAEALAYRTIERVLLWESW